MSEVGGARAAAVGDGGGRALGRPARDGPGSRAWGGASSIGGVA